MPNVLCSRQPHTPCCHDPAVACHHPTRMSQSAASLPLGLAPWLPLSPAQVPATTRWGCTGRQWTTTRELWKPKGRSPQGHPMSWCRWGGGWQGCSCPGTGGPYAGLGSGRVALTLHQTALLRASADGHFNLPPARPPSSTPCCLCAWPSSRRRWRCTPAGSWMPTCSPSALTLTWTQSSRWVEGGVGGWVAGWVGGRAGKGAGGPAGAG
jgi:hypothetical protein